MRDYHKALVIVAACSLVLAGGLFRAYLAAPKPLTSAEILTATRRAVDLATDAAIREGGLKDAQGFVRYAIDLELWHQGFDVPEVRLRRPNDLNPFASFYFFVEAEDISVRFDLEGTRDPLHAIRLGVLTTIRQDPNHPYEGHRDARVLSTCVAHPYYHHAPEGPDFFARLENRTRDPYHFGFEALLTEGRVLAADYAFFETGNWGLDETHRERYGQ